jgi:hypothetical protein
MRNIFVLFLLLLLNGIPVMASSNRYNRYPFNTYTSVPQTVQFINGSLLQTESNWSGLLFINPVDQKITNKVQFSSSIGPTTFAYDPIHGEVLVLSHPTMQPESLSLVSIHYHEIFNNIAETTRSTKMNTINGPYVDKEYLQYDNYLPWEDVYGDQQFVVANDNASLAFYRTSPFQFEVYTLLGNPNQTHPLVGPVIIKKMLYTVDTNQGKLYIISMTNRHVLHIVSVGNSITQLVPGPGELFMISNQQPTIRIFNLKQEKITGTIVPQIKTTPQLVLSAVYGEGKLFFSTTSPITHHWLIGLFNVQTNRFLGSFQAKMPPKLMAYVNHELYYSNGLVPIGMFLHV